jgi:hypothetical protein
VQDRLDVERWINEGGHVATEALIQREIAAGNDGPGGSVRQRDQTARPAVAGDVGPDTPVTTPYSQETPARSRVAPGRAGDPRPDRPGPVAPGA